MTTVRDVCKYLDGIGVGSKYYDNAVELCFGFKYSENDSIEYMNLIVNEGDIEKFLSAVFGSLGAPQSMRDQVFKKLTSVYMVDRYLNLGNYKSLLDTQIASKASHELPSDQFLNSLLNDDNSKSIESPGWYSARGCGGGGSAGADPVVVTRVCGEYMRIITGDSKVNSNLSANKGGDYQVNRLNKQSARTYVHLGEKGESGSDAKVFYNGSILLLAPGGRGGYTSRIKVEWGEYKEVRKSREVVTGYSSGPSGSRIPITRTEYYYVNEYVSYINQGLANVSKVDISQSAPTVSSAVGRALSMYYTSAGGVEGYARSQVAHGNVTPLKEIVINNPQASQAYETSYKWYVSGMFTCKPVPGGTRTYERGFCVLKEVREINHNDEIHRTYIYDNGGDYRSRSLGYSEVVKLANR